LTTKRILITGSSGNLGSKLVLEGQQRQWDIVAWSKHGDDNGSQAYNLTPWYIGQYALRHEAPFDLVVMTHGVHSTAGVQDYTPEHAYEVLDTNLMSCVSLTHHLVAMNKLNSQSLLVYCSSIQAATPRPCRGLYAIAKAGVEALAKSVAQDLAADKRAIALRLGSFTTPMNHEPVMQPGDNYLTSRCLVQRINPALVAKFCFELYDHSSMTGCVIDYDAGMGRNIW
jgi:NAD(P)-dependent dehydrogenase (short-subunit alcohol dehydrogenase family)